MSSEPGETIRYAVPWNAWVWGQYPAARDYRADGTLEPQWVEMWCGHPECMDKPAGYYRVLCGTGNMRQHIAKFAYVHLHADPLASDPK